MSPAGVKRAFKEALKEVTINANVDIQTGVFELKDGETDNRAKIDDSGRVWISIQEDAVGLKQTMVGVFQHTTPLLANDSVESDAIPTNGYSRIVGSVFADVDGTLYVEQSPNGTNWDVVDSFPVSGGSGLGFSVEVVCPYCRVRYVNSASDQSKFRLYVFLRRY